MTIALASYRSFNYTHSVLDSGRKTWNTAVSGILELIKKVARVALAALALPFAFLLDLVLWPVAALYQRCWTKTAPPVLAQSKLIDSGNLAERVLSNPYLGSAGLPSDANQFFQDALRVGLALNFSLDQTRISIIVEGMRKKNTEAPIWAAGCLLTHYLVARLHSSTKLFPSIFPHSISYKSKLPSKISSLYDAFLKLSPSDRSAILLNAVSAVDDPSDENINTDRGKSFSKVEDITAMMIQDATFLAFYGKAVDNIQAIADSVVKRSKPV